MANMRAQAAYVKGLLSGLGTDNDSREMRLLSEIVKVLNDFAERLDELREAQDDMEEYVQALDEDLYAVETAVFGAEDEEEGIEDSDSQKEQARQGGNPGLLETPETIAPNMDVF